MEALIAVVIGLLLISPIISLIALITVRRIQKRLADLDQLQNRLRALEAKLEPAPPRQAPSPRPAAAVEERKPASPSASPTSRPIAANPPAPEPATEARPAVSIEWETLIGGRWLNVVAILALLLAAGFFLKYAFDNNWVGPRGRIAIGLFAGTAFFASSYWLRNRGYRYFADGIAALGSGVLYLSLYAGWNFYQVFPLAAAMAGMVVVTIALTVTAIGRNSQILAILGLVGGFLTPVLLSTGRDAQVALFTYILLLNAGMLLLSRAKRWVSLEWLSFVLSLVYFAGWWEAHYLPAKLGLTLLFGALLFLEFGVAPAWLCLKKKVWNGSDAAITLTNSLWFMIALQGLLYREHRWTLTAAVIVLAALNLALARIAESSADSSRLSNKLYAGLALTFATLAIPIRLEGRWITIAWAIEGGALALVGIRERVQFLRGASYVLFAIVTWRLLLLPIPIEKPFLNARLAAFAVSAATMAFALYTAKRAWETVADWEHSVLGALGVTVNVLLVWALSAEAWVWFGVERFGVDFRLAQHLAISVLWAAYATGLIVFGTARNSAALRWQGLVLLVVAIGKAFLFDLSFLERGYRILSFLALGALLLLVSFIYQRKIAPAKGQVD